MPEWENIFLTLHGETCCPVDLAKYILKNKSYKFSALLEVFFEQGGQKNGEGRGP